jgi:hypothetical protein
MAVRPDERRAAATAGDWGCAARDARWKKADGCAGEQLADDLLLVLGDGEHDVGGPVRRTAGG